MKILALFMKLREAKYVTGKTIHLHPKHIGGAIVSIDKMEPESAWLWAGLDWEKCVQNDNAERLSGVVMQSDDKSALCKKWEKAFGIKQMKIFKLISQTPESSLLIILIREARELMLSSCP